MSRKRGVAYRKDGAMCRVRVNSRVAGPLIITIHVDENGSSPDGVRIVNRRVRPNVPASDRDWLTTWCWQNGVSAVLPATAGRDSDEAHDVFVAYWQANVQ
jgi:hypothetical protein